MDKKGVKNQVDRNQPAKRRDGRRKQEKLSSKNKKDQVHKSIFNPLPVPFFFSFKKKPAWAAGAEITSIPCA